MINWGDVKDWLGVAALVITGIGWPALMYRLNKEFASKGAQDQLSRKLDSFIADHSEEHAELEERLQAGERQFAAIAADIEHLPTRDDFHDIVVKLEAVKGAMLETNQKIEGMRDVLQAELRPVKKLVEFHMVEGASK